MVVDIILSLKAALATEGIKFCFVDEVALNYYNVPRVINGLEVCVPEKDLLKAESLLASKAGLFKRLDWMDDKLPNYYTDYKRPYPRFESVAEGPPLTVIIFPDTFFYLDPLERNIVRQVDHVNTQFEYSKHFDMSSDIGILSSIPVPRLASFLEGLLRKYCNSQDYKMAMCAEQLVDGMDIDASWCYSHLDTERHDELQFALELVNNKPLRISQLNYYVSAETADRARMIPGYNEVSWNRQKRADDGVMEDNGVAEGERAAEDNSEQWKRKRRPLLWTALLFSIQTRTLAWRSIFFARNRRTSVPFQVMSDLHLEVGNSYSSFHIPQAAPYLILAGDIGRLHDYRGYLQFLSFQCAKFEHVYLVLGNHEFIRPQERKGLILSSRSHLSLSYMANLLF